MEQIVLSALLIVADANLLLIVVPVLMDFIFLNNYVYLALSIVVFALPLIHALFAPMDIFYKQI